MIPNSRNQHLQALRQWPGDMRGKSPSSLRSLVKIATRDILDGITTNYTAKRHCSTVIITTTHSRDSWRLQFLYIHSRTVYPGAIKRDFNLFQPIIFTGHE